MVLPATKTTSDAASLNSRRKAKVWGLLRSHSRPSYFTEPVTRTRGRGTPEINEPFGVLLGLRGDSVQPPEGRAERASESAVTAVASPLSRPFTIATLAPTDFAAHTRFGQNSNSTSASTVGRMRRRPGASPS